MTLCRAQASRVFTGSEIPQVTSHPRDDSDRRTGSLVAARTSALPNKATPLEQGALKEDPLLSSLGSMSKFLGQKRWSRGSLQERQRINTPAAGNSAYCKR
ncbi:hypothetical protein ACCO45_000661 [Purpureocillium lilacinum]|uniref:Uncharacterized protein n=1 Tax=Purpureocillium lilacinum TaxID=33203 RepID=A0ACC4E5Y2_PURLI